MTSEGLELLTDLELLNELSRRNACIVYACAKITKGDVRNGTEQVWYHAVGPMSMRVGLANRLHIRMLNLSITGGRMVEDGEQA